MLCAVFLFCNTAQEEDTRVHSIAVPELPLISQGYAAPHISDQQQQQQQQEPQQEQQTPETAAAAVELRRLLATGVLDSDLSIQAPSILCCQFCDELLLEPVVLSCGHVVCGPTCTPAAVQAVQGVEAMHTGETVQAAEATTASTAPAAGAAAAGAPELREATAGGGPAPTAAAAAAGAPAAGEPELRFAASTAGGGPAPTAASAEAAAAAKEAAAGMLTCQRASQQQCLVCGVRVVEPQPQTCMALDALLCHCLPQRTAARRQQVQEQQQQQLQLRTWLAKVGLALVGAEAAGKSSASAEQEGAPHPVGPVNSAGQEQELHGRAVGPPPAAQAAGAGGGGAGEGVVGAAEGGVGDRDGYSSRQQQLSVAVRELLGRSQPFDALQGELQQLMRGFADTNYVWHQVRAPGLWGGRSA